MRESTGALVGCVAGAVMKGEYLDSIRLAGFEKVEVLEEKSFALDMFADEAAGDIAARTLGMDAEELERAARRVRSVSVRAEKPGTG